MKVFSNTDLFLLDLDGTIYHGSKIIDGAITFIKEIIAHGKQYVFITNNSSLNRKDYLNKLTKMGIPCTEKNIFTAGTATANYLSEEKKGKSVYVVGTTSYQQELLDYNITLSDTNPDIILICSDKELTYKKLEIAYNCLLKSNTEFIATNPDLCYTVENNLFIPDCGAFCHMLELLTNKKPVYIGKPEPYIVNVLSKEFNIPLKKIVVIGDRLYTDIKLAANANVMSVCVLTGEATLEEIKKSSYKPDFIFNSIKDLIEQL